MPELPEVETVARQLSPLVSGRTLKRVSILDERLKPCRTPRGALGRRVDRVYRYGKQVMFDLGEHFIAVHLRMTGRLVWYDEPLSRRKPIDHLRAVFHLDRGSVLFIDTRRFGTVAWVDDPKKILGRTRNLPAVDPMSDDFTIDALEQRLGAGKQELKAWLLRQDRIVGLGNIYASEILHDAKLAPTRETGSLDSKETRALHASTRKILERAIDNCGTTFSDFQDAHGVTGSYQQYLGVYGREGQPCPRCGAEISRIVQQQRSTFFCSGCQG